MTPGMSDSPRPASHRRCRYAPVRTASASNAFTGTISLPVSRSWCRDRSSCSTCAPPSSCSPCRRTRPKSARAACCAIAAAIQATPVQRVVVEVVGADERAARDEPAAQGHPPRADDGDRGVVPGEEVQVVELFSRALQPRASGDDRQFDALPAGQVEDRLALKVGEREPIPSSVSRSIRASR